MIILDQGWPIYASCLKPEFWADRTVSWTEHFVTIAKKMKDGKISHRQVPVHPKEYLQNPTAWPKGNVGMLRTAVILFLNIVGFLKFSKKLNMLNLV